MYTTSLHALWELYSSTDSHAPLPAPLVIPTPSLFRLVAPSEAPWNCQRRLLLRPIRPGDAAAQRCTVKSDAFVQKTVFSRAYVGM